MLLVNVTVFFNSLYKFDENTEHVDAFVFLCVYIRYEFYVFMSQG